MKASKTISILAFLTAVIVGHTSFAQTMSQLCKTRCEYNTINQDTPTCCSSEPKGSQEMTIPDHENINPHDCSRAELATDIPELFLLTTHSGSADFFTEKVYQTASSFTKAITFPALKTIKHYNRFGLSPPGIKRIPSYTIHCTLLI